MTIRVVNFPGSPDRGPVRLALVGFGHVGRAFCKLLLAKEAILLEERGLQTRVTSILTARHGFLVDEAGADLRSCLAQDRLPERGLPPLVEDLPADILIEVSTLNIRDGQPALDTIKEALRADLHVITANKGPIAHGYAELERLAQERNRLLRFESAVADNLPIFNLLRFGLPGVRVERLRGVLNSTSNFVLDTMAVGSGFAAALEEAVRRGIAERDPSNDLEGWDAAAKAAILAQVLRRSPVEVAQVARQPVTEQLAAQARAARERGKRLRMVMTIDDAGARWAAEVLPPEDPLFAVSGFSMGLEIETDVAGRLFLSLRDPGVEQTAFGLLADLVEITGSGAG